MLFSLFVALLGITSSLASLERNLHFARDTDGLQNNVRHALVSRNIAVR